jgi:hypothetical protein
MTEYQIRRRLKDLDYDEEEIEARTDELADEQQRDKIDRELTETP